MARSRPAIDRGTLIVVVILSLTALAFTLISGAFTLDNNLVYGAF